MVVLTISNKKIYLKKYQLWEKARSLKRRSRRKKKLS